MTDLDKKVEAFFERFGDIIFRKLNHQKHWTLPMVEKRGYFPTLMSKRVWDTLTESQKNMVLEDDYKNACLANGSHTFAIILFLYWLSSLVY